MNAYICQNIKQYTQNLCIYLKIIPQFKKEMAEIMQIWPAFQAGYLNWLSQTLSPIWRSWKAENIFPWYPQS